MKSIYFFTGIIICLSSSLYAQKRVLFFENVALEVELINKADSLGGEVTITSYRDDTIYIPFLKSSNKPRFEISVIGGVFDLRAGHSSRFSGLSLESSQVLIDLKPKESIKFRTSFVKKNKVFKFVTALDFITGKDLQDIFNNTLSPKPLTSISDLDYVSHIHIGRAEFFCQ